LKSSGERFKKLRDAGKPLYQMPDSVLINGENQASNSGSGEDKPSKEKK